VTAHNKNAAKHAGDKKRGRTDVSCRSIDYWLGTGISEEEAKEKVRMVQDTNSLARYVRKYGELDGFVKWTERQVSWQKTMTSKSDDEQADINLRKMVKLCRASNESMKVFLPVMGRCAEIDLKFYIGYGDNQEYFMWSDRGRIFFYDLVIPELKLVFEYNGISWHPSPKLSKLEWHGWRNPISGVDAETQAEIDRTKEQLAGSKGFTVHTIWGDDAKASPSLEIERVLKIINDAHALENQ
jgi:hypothetical protein